MDTESGYGISLLNFRGRNGAAGLSLSAEELVRSTNHGRHSLRLPLQRKTTSSSSFGLLALGTFLSLAIAYLLSRCAGYLKIRYNAGGPSRKLAGGGSSSPIDCFSGNPSEEEVGAGRYGAQLETWQGHGSVAGEAVAVAQEGQGLQRSEQQQGREVSYAPLQFILKRMERIADDCQNLVSRLTSEQSFQVLQHVARLEVLDMAFFSLLDVGIESQRQRIIGLYIGMVRTFLEERAREVDKQSLRWLKDFLKFLKRSHEGCGKKVSKEKSGKFILNGSELASLSSVYVQQSLERLTSALKIPESSQSSDDPENPQTLPSDLLERELNLLESFRSLRATQTLAIGLTRQWLSRCQKSYEIWTVFSADELEYANGRPSLPTLDVQCQEIRAIAKAAGEEEPFSGDQSRAEVLNSGERASGETLSSQRTRTHQREASFLDLAPKTHTLLSVMFALLGKVAKVAMDLEHNCDAEGYLQLVSCVTKLAVVELGACSTLPGSLDPRRGQVAQEFIEPALQALARNPSRAASPAAQELRNLLRLLKAMDTPVEFHYRPKAATYEKAMSQQATVSRFAIDAVLSLLHDLKRSPPGTLSASTMKSLLERLEDLARLRVHQIRRRGILRHCLAKAQSRAGVEMFDFSEANDDSGDIRTEKMIDEIHEIDANIWVSLDSLLQVPRPPKTSDDAWLAGAHAFAQITAPTAQSPRPGYEAVHPSHLRGVRSRVSANVESDAGAAAATAPHFSHTPFRQKKQRAPTHSETIGEEGPERMLTLYQQAQAAAALTPSSVTRDLAYFGMPEGSWGAFDKAHAHMHVSTAQAARGIPAFSDGELSHIYQAASESRFEYFPTTQHLGYFFSGEGAQEASGRREPHVPREHMAVSQYKPSVGLRQAMDSSTWKDAEGVGSGSLPPVATPRGQRRDEELAGSDASSARQLPQYSGVDMVVRAGSEDVQTPAPVFAEALEEKDTEESGGGHLHGGAIGVRELERGHSQLLETLQNILLDILASTLRDVPHSDEK